MAINPRYKGTKSVAIVRELVFRSRFYTLTSDDLQELADKLTSYHQDDVLKRYDSVNVEAVNMVDDATKKLGSGIVVDLEKLLS